MRAIVVGAGIAGLSTAIAFRRVGIEAKVFERAPRLEEVGAGISLWPNAVVGLEALGVAGAVRARGAVGRRTTLRTSRGRVLTDATWDTLSLQGVGIHRADLQAALLESLDPAVVRLGMACTGFVQDRTGVVARFAEGAEERGDVLVGADGIHSVVRSGLVGDESPRYAGYVGWRAVVRPGADLVEPGRWNETWGRGVRFGFLDIGLGRTYWFATQNAPSGGEARPQGRKRELLGVLGGWHEPIEALLTATEEGAIFRTDIQDRKPARRWSAGRVTLAGDAAHPMTPNLGQGAAQAIEDAVVLAASLRGEAEVASALRLYESRRRRRANGFVTQSWQFGRIAQLENPLACKIRGAAVRLLPDRLQRAQFERMVKFEI